MTPAKLSAAGALVGILSIGGYWYFTSGHSAPAVSAAAPAAPVAVSKLLTPAAASLVGKAVGEQLATKGDAQHAATMPAPLPKQQLDPPREPAESPGTLGGPAHELCMGFANYPLKQSIDSLETHLRQSHTLNEVTLCFIRVALARINCEPVAAAVEAGERETRTRLAHLLGLPESFEDVVLAGEIDRVPAALRALEARQAFQRAIPGKADDKTACKDPA